MTSACEVGFPSAKGWAWSRNRPRRHLHSTQINVTWKLNVNKSLSTSLISLKISMSIFTRHLALKILQHAGLCDHLNDSQVTPPLWPTLASKQHGHWPHLPASPISTHYLEGAPKICAEHLQRLHGFLAVQSCTRCRGWFPTFWIPKNWTHPIPIPMPEQRMVTLSLPTRYRISITFTQRVWPANPSSKTYFESHACPFLASGKWKLCFSVVKASLMNNLFKATSPVTGPDHVSLQCFLHQ